MIGACWCCFAAAIDFEDILEFLVLLYILYVLVATGTELLLGPPEHHNNDKTGDGCGVEFCCNLVTSYTSFSKLTAW